MSAPCAPAAPRSTQPCELKSRESKSRRRFLFKRVFLAGSLALALALGLAGPLQAATFDVTSTADDHSPGTLRWAIDQANTAGAGAHSITFSIASNSVLQLDTPLPELDNPDATVELNGAGAGGVTISGHDNHRVLFVNRGSWLVRNVNIVQGKAEGGAGGENSHGGGGGGLGAGGAIFVNQNAHLTVQNVNFTGNNAIGGDGGGATGNNVGGGGGGGLGGDGGNGGIEAGGGGGGSWGDGGHGGVYGGGGAGGAVLPGLPGGAVFGGAGALLGGDGGTVGFNGGDGFTFGGGGGGGAGGSGGDGGDFGGGGGAGRDGLGGDGGFGGGGGGSLLTPAGQGGFGAGNGGVGSGGNGGSGYGGAVFVRQGGTFTVINSTTSGNGIEAGSAGVPGGTGGQAGGQDLYLMSGVNAGFGGTSNHYTGSIAGQGALTQNAGTTTLLGTNTYSGGTTVSGGLLRGTTNSLQGQITNNSQVEFDQSGAGTYGGVMTGSGALYKEGAGNVTLTGNNNFGGGTFVNSGTLTVSSSTITGTITTSATLTFDQAADASYAGSLLGTGQMLKEGAGNLTLTNTSNNLGTIQVNAGTLTGNTTTLGANAINANTDGTLVFEQATDGATATAFGGSGQIFKDGAGTLNLTGASGFTGRFDVIEGGLAVNGAIAGDTYIGGAGVLSGTGSINASVYNYGTVAAGNSIGSLTVGHDYTMYGGSIQAVEVNDAGTTPGINNDLVDVTGDAFLAGGMVEIQATVGTYAEGDTFTFLKANSITGQYDGINVSGISGLHAVLGYDRTLGSSSAFFALFDTQSDFISVAETYNERQVATYVDDLSAGSTGQLRDVIDQMEILSPAGQRQALNELTGVVNGSMAQLGVQDTAFLYQLLRRRVGSGFAAGGVIGSGEGSGWASAGTSKPAKNLVMPASFTDGARGTDMGTAATTPYSTPNSWGGWMTGYGFGGSAQSDGNAAGGTFGSGGTIIAMERALSDSSLVGVFGAYSHLGMSLSGLPQNASADQGLFGTYLLHEMDSHYILAASSVGFAGYSSTRHIQFGTVDLTAEGDYDGWQPTAYLEYGRRGQWGRTTIQPYLAAQYIYLRQNGFTETGAGDLNLEIAGVDTNALRGLLGLRAAQTWATSGGHVWVPELRAVWMHEFLEPDTTLTAVFAPIGGSSFSTRGLNLGRDWAILGGGTQYILSEHVSLFANYDLLVNSQQAWNAGSGGVQFAW